MKTVRMTDIAERLGISVVSVSNGLSGRSGVSEEMRAKILETAKEMGYGPVVRSGARNPSGTNIGILCPDHFFGDNSFYIGLYRAVSQECSKLGYSALMELISPQMERNGVLPLLVSDRKVDALIFLGEVRGDYLEAVLRCGLPAVLLDFYNSEVASIQDSVLSDNTWGGYVLTQHLLRQGRERLCFVGSIFATTSIMDRYLGFEKAILQAGGKPCSARWIEDRDADAHYLPFQLPEDMPDGFVCGCDEAGFHLIRQLQSQGIRVPEDVSVVGYDDSPFARLSTPAMTAYRVDVEGMAMAAVCRLQEKLAGKRSWQGAVVVSGKLISRGSSEL